MTTLPAHNSTYASAAYWEDRFQEEQEYEWFKGYASFNQLIEALVPRSSRVLVLGCGTSRLAEDMYALSGYANIVSTDLSSTVVARMRERATREGLPSSLSWEVADMLALPFAASSFDCVLEKGTIDCLLTTVRDPWNVPEETAALCRTALSEAHRVLRPDCGLLVSITFSQPHFRRPLLYDGPFDWRVKHIAFGEGGAFAYHLFAATRGLKQPDEPGEAEPIRQGSYVPPDSMVHDDLDGPGWMTMIGGSDDELP